LTKKLKILGGGGEDAGRWKLYRVVPPMFVAGGWRHPWKMEVELVFCY